MATYRQIQERVRSQIHRVPKTCWIAHVMADKGLRMKAAPNRISTADRQKPCPPDKRPAILAALRHFRMIGSN